MTIPHLNGVLPVCPLYTLALQMANLRNHTCSAVPQDSQAGDTNTSDSYNSNTAYEENSTLERYAAMFSFV